MCPMKYPPEKKEALDAHLPTNDKGLNAPAWQPSGSILTTALGLLQPKKTLG